MANLKEIRNRIASVASTKQITKAMKMVSAAKLRKSQNSVNKLSPYMNKLEEIMGHLNIDPTESTNIYLKEREVERIALIVIASNKGLCGAFNYNIAKLAVEVATTKYKEQFNKRRVDFIVIGKKAAEALKSRGYKISEQYNELLNEVNFEKAADFTEMMLEHFNHHKYDRIEIIYNKFKNAATQLKTVEQLIPIRIENEQTDRIDNFLFEPSEKEVFETIVLKKMKMQMLYALLNSQTSEHGARMTSMHKATDNAEALLHDLKLNYNKARQSDITNEILEIVSAANALA